MLLGGAAGGGKSDGLLMLALQYVDIPNYSAGIFRLTKEDLNKPTAILHRAHQWWTGTAAKWDADAHSYRFPSGATIHFGYGKSKQEIMTRYQGPAFQFIGVEEAGQWTKSAYTYLFSRLRREVSVPVPLRMRATCNPGGVGAEWIKERFIEFSQMEGNPRYTVKELVAEKKRGEKLPDRPVFVSAPSTEAVELAKKLGREAQGAYFLPWFAVDNPGLDVNEYLFQLAKMDDAERQQLEHGDWWAAAGGGLFKAEWFKYIDYAPEDLWPLCRAWDLAATEPRKGKDPDWTAGGKLGIQHVNYTERKQLEDEIAAAVERGELTKAKYDFETEDRVIIVDARRTRAEAGGVELFVRDTAEEDGKEVQIFIEQEGGASGKISINNFATKVLKGWMVEGVPKSTGKVEMWKPLQSDARNGMVYLVRGPWNAEVVSELCSLTRDDTHAHDDYADALAQGRAKCFEDEGLWQLRLWGKQD